MTDVEITSVGIELNEGCANDYELIVSFNHKLPKYDELVWQDILCLYHTSSVLYYTTNSPVLVDFLVHNKEAEWGYGGSLYNLKLVSGDTVEIKGPWSSRASIVSGIIGKDYMEFRDAPKGMSSDVSGCGRAVSVEHVVKYLKAHSELGIGLLKVKHEYEVWRGTDEQYEEVHIVTYNGKTKHTEDVGQYKVLEVLC